jgi:hypothetical protein
MTARLCRTAACRRTPLADSPFCRACRSRLAETAFGRPVVRPVVERLFVEPARPR